MDYTTFDKNASDKIRASGDAGYWWKLETPKERADAIVAAARVMKGSQERSDRAQANLTHARLYGNTEQLGFGTREYSRAASAPQQKISLNVCCACVDTLASKIAKNRPRPMFLTDGGNFGQQKQAKKLDKFMRGLFYETKIYEKSAQVFTDCGIFDIAALKFYFDPISDKMKVERVFPDELFVDNADGKYGEPRQLFQANFVAKEVLQAEVEKRMKGKELEEALLTISAYVAPEESYLKGFGDVVEIWEAWHLPSYEGAKDGRHVVAMLGCELFEEQWKPMRFPFAFLRFSKRVLGFWGQSLVERLSGIQLEINRLLRSVSEQLRRKGRGRIFCKIGSKVNTEHLRNAIGDVVFYTGDHPPVVDNGNAVAPEEFNQLDRLYQRAFQEAGISELSAGAKKPSGLDAAVALREFADVESERFSMVGKAWEQLFLDAADVMIELLCIRGGSYPVKHIAKRSTEDIDWKDINLARDQYVMQMFPVSSLPQTPAYRLQRVTELVQEGYIPDKSEALRLLDFPDLESETNLALAAIDDADESISAILDQDPPKFIQPDEFSDPNAIVSRASAAYLRAKHHGVDDERMNLLVRLIDAAKMILNPPVDPNAMPQPGEMPPGMPAGAPMPGMPMPAPGAGGVPPNITNTNVLNNPQAATVPPLIPQ
jgi:hypothetical protein